MSTSKPSLDLKPRVAEPELLKVLLREQSARWPKAGDEVRLSRFALFKRKRDGDTMRYRALSFDDFENELYVIPIYADACPEKQMRVIKWRGDAIDSPLSDLYLCDESVAPPFMRDSKSTLPEAVRSSIDERMKVVNALLFVDKSGKGKPKDFLFNDAVVRDEFEWRKAVNHVIEAAGKNASYRTQVGRLAHRFAYYGGGECALADLTCRMGRPKKAKAGTFQSKPGPKNAREIASQWAAAAKGKAESVFRQTPVLKRDLKKFVKALTNTWALNRKSLADAYHLMVEEDYADVPEHMTPRLPAFYYHARNLIPRYRLRSLRNGKTISAQYNLARVGQSTDLTQGVIGVVDIDGFRAKIPVAALIDDELVSIPITVILAVCRNSHAIVGYYIAIEGENSEAFRHCIANIYSDKTARALELGLTDTSGLVSGSIDGIFVDNGAGAAEAVVVVACDEMNLWRMLPPPGRGDYKGVVESINSLMVQLMKSEAGGYTRANDHLSKLIRRIKRKDRPITAVRFEQLLLLAISHHNLYSNKEQLRVEGMESVDITPAPIFRFLQDQRLGDGKTMLTYREALSRFVPWQRSLCQKGAIRIDGLRFTSEALVELFNDRAEAMNKKDREVWVSWKPLSGDPKQLIWLRPNGEEALLRMVDEDVRRVGDKCELEVKLMRMDEKAREARNAKKRGLDRAHLSGNEHRLVSEAARNRAMDDLGGLVGSSVPEARANAKRIDDKKRGKAWLREAGLTDSNDIYVGSDAVPPTESASEPSEYAEYIAALAARRANEGAGPQRPAA
ncbi:hypothetical protein BYI23_A025150 [Burkholderia sp. YI23]|nr:hypothetical protein BYI23_A025150 [Burkholderia sp. YI23]